MNSKSFNARFLQTIGAYGCAVFIGVYFSSAYSQVATKAVFLAIPVLTLAVARNRTRRTSGVLQFPAEAVSASTHVLAERDHDMHPRYLDIARHAS